MYIVTLALTALLNHAVQPKTECDELLHSLEDARGQRVPSIVLRAQLNEAFAADPSLFKTVLLLEQARHPEHSLEDALRATLAKLRRYARRR